MNLNKQHKINLELIPILLIYLAIRLPLIAVQNAYVDYDEGTYLLIGRLINEGFLPYRDIFAVHPPLYYYALSAWLHIFGDTYVSGRMFSLFLGLISVVVAYHIGHRIGGKELGTIFALLVALDPTAIKINTLVLHESFIELFTLLSLLGIIEYLNSKKIKYAYLSIIVAAIASAAKFTVIPYLFALYLFIIFWESETLRKYLLKITSLMLTKKQLFVIVGTYLLWAVITILISILLPSRLVRTIMIIPGLHGIDKIGQIYTSIVLFFFWLLLNIYVFKLSFVKDIFISIHELKHNFKLLISLGILIILSKAIIEIPLGVVVSHNYIHQTYLEQSSRGFFFVGLFWFFHDILHAAQSNSLDVLIYMLPSFFLIGVIMIGRPQHEQKDSIHVSASKSLLVLVGVSYLIIFPLIPTIRFIYPMFLVLYLSLLVFFQKRFSQRFFRVSTIVLLLFLLIADVGFAINYPQGNLSIPSTPHIQKFRDDLGNYIREYNLANGKYLSINPMDTFYLGLPTIPYMIDTFGLGYLRGVSLVRLLDSYTPRYLVFDTWMFEMMNRSKTMKRIYWPVFRYAVSNGTLRFSEFNTRGEVVQLFDLDLSRNFSKFKIATLGNAIVVYHRGKETFKLTPSSYPEYVLKIIYVTNGTYQVNLMTENTSEYGTILVGSDSISINMSESRWKISFNGIPCSKMRLPITSQSELSDILLCLSSGDCILGQGEFSITNRSVILKGHATFMARR